MAVEHAELLKQLPKQFELNESDLVVNSSLIGSDFFATTVRAWPQFFFGYVLPFPLLQAFTFVAAAYFWTKRAKEVRDNSILTDEFILSFLALQGQVHLLDDAGKAKNAEVNERIKKLKEESDAERARIWKLETFVRNYKQNILDALKATVTPLEDTDTAVDKASKQWSKGFRAAFQFATAHWVLWMAGVLLYYSQGRWEFDEWHGVHKEFSMVPTEVPGAFEDNTAFILQFALPAAITAAAIFYNWYYRQNDEQKIAQDAWKKRQASVRAEYLVNDKPVQENKTNITFTEKRVVALSLGTAFWDAFLVGNLLAWPVTAFADRMMSNKDNRGDALDSETKILCVFAGVMAMCAINMFFKYTNMKKELRDHEMADATLDRGYVAKQTFWEYYKANKRTAVNIVFDRASGSGGILAMRFIFDGGIGGYLVDKKNPSGMDHVNEVLPIAVTAMCLMIVLNLFQTYYAAQRQAAMSANKDAHLVSRKQGITF